MWFFLGVEITFFRFNRHLTPSISDMSSSQNELPTSDRNTGTQIGSGAGSATNLQDGKVVAVLPATDGAGEAVLTLAAPTQQATKSVETPKKKRIHTARKVGTFSNSKSTLLLKYKNENESLSKLKNFKDLQENLRSSPRLQNLCAVGQGKYYRNRCYPWKGE